MGCIEKHTRGGGWRNVQWGDREIYKGAGGGETHKGGGDGETHNFEECTYMHTYRQTKRGSNMLKHAR